MLMALICLIKMFGTAMTVFVIAASLVAIVAIFREMWMGDNPFEETDTSFY